MIRDKNAVFYSCERGIGNFRKSLALGCCSDGVIVFQLRLFELAEHVHPTVDRSGRKYIFVACKQIAVC